jgi:hypothetical protein
MQKIGKAVMAALVITTVVAGMSACQKQEGPAEKAGQAIDNAVSKTGEQIEKAGDKIQDAGDKAQDAAKDAKN